MSATGVAGNSERTGMRRAIRCGIGLLVGVAFGILSLAPGRASDAEELCRLKLGFYVETIDIFLEEDERPKPSYSLEPYFGLNEGVPPLKGCTIEEVKATVAKSKFAKPPYNQIRDVWVFTLSNSRIKVGFSYLADQKKSEFHYASWVKKFL